MTTFPFDPSWDRQDLNRNHNELVEGEVVLWRNAQWRVTNQHLEEKARPDIMGPAYWIPISQLRDQSTIEHVSQKMWVDRDLFAAAYAAACEIHGIIPIHPTERYTAAMEALAIAVRDIEFAAQDAVDALVAGLSTLDFAEVSEAVERGWGQQPGASFGAKIIRAVHNEQHERGKAV